MMREYYYDATDTGCRSRIGGVPAGDSVTFTFRLNRRLFAYHVLFKWESESGEQGVFPMRWRDTENDENLYCCEFTPKTVELYRYHFEVDLFGRYLKLGCNSMHCAEECKPLKKFQLTVYAPEFVTPDWFKGGIMYHIFVDRFHRSAAYSATPRKGVLREDWGGLPSYRPIEGKVLNRDFFGGNLTGIIEKLDYLKSLNVRTIYLSPIFEAASNHKYDTGDYERIDPLFGDENIFRRLCSEADALGMRIILDGVFNHTGDDSRYFNRYGSYPELGACQSPESPYYSWYSFSHFPDRYRCWWGIDILPEINRNCGEFQDYIAGDAGVISKWMEAGTSGFRLDVVDELSDGFTARIRDAVKRERPDGLVIGEVWEDASCKVAYGERRRYLEGEELDSCMNYPFRSGILEYLRSGKAEALSVAVRTVLDHYPKQVRDVLMNLVGTHDTERLITALGASSTPENKEDRANYRMSETERLRGGKLVMMASLIQFTLPGVPCIYYGDEQGMEGFEDPFNRVCFNWTRAECSLKKWYEGLGQLRALPVFREGEFYELYCGNGVYLYERAMAGERVLIGLNRGRDPFLFRAEGFCNYFTGDCVEQVEIAAEYGFTVLVKYKSV